MVDPYIFVCRGPVLAQMQADRLSSSGTGPAKVEKKDPLSPYGNKSWPLNTTAA